MSKLHLPDIIDENLRVLFCGLNPGLSSAVGGHHFMNKSNRFWKTLHLSGFTPEEIQSENDRDILKYGCGLTAVVARPTKNAAELSKGEYAKSSKAFEKKILKFHPQYIAFLGKAGFAELSGIKLLSWGEQPDLFAGSKVWILPNPSGLNRNFTLKDLVKEYSKLNSRISNR